MTKFNHCPNCKETPSRGLLGGNWMTIYECRKCKKLYCYKCGDKRCPDCGSKDRDDAGHCYSK